MRRPASADSRVALMTAIAVLALLVAGAVPALAFDRAGQRGHDAAAHQSRPHAAAGCTRSESYEAARPGGARALPGHARSRLLLALVAERR